MDKQLIIDASFDLIVENGLEEFSIAKLSSKLNCTKSSIYNYFKSKDDLLNQLFLKKTETLNENININDDPEKIIRQYAHNCIANYQVFVFFNKYMTAKFINSDTKLEVTKEVTQIRDVVKKYVTKHADSTKVNPVVFEALIFGPIHGLVMRRGMDTKISSSDVEDLVDYILASIRKENNEGNS